MISKKGRGSVSRSFNYERKMKDSTFRKKVSEARKFYNKRKKLKVNNRCIDCKKLISMKANRCRTCSILNNRNKYLVTLK